MIIPTFLKDFSANDTPLAKKGLENFVEKGVPHKKIENWHYTDLKKMISGDVYDATSTPFISNKHIDGVIAVSIVAGQYDADTSEPVDGLVITPINMNGSVGSIANTDAHSMVALNTAVYKGGVSIEITKTLDTPIHIAFSSAGDSLAIMPRVFVSVASGVTATLVETYDSAKAGKQLVNAVTEISMGTGSVLNHYKMQDDESVCTHVSYTEANLEASAMYNQTAIFANGHVSRNESRVHLNGEEAHANLRGLYIAQGEQHIDNTICVNHNAPDCTSEQLFKGILNDQSKAIFQGKIYVDKVAQKTDGYQMHRSILLSRDAEVSCKPELEIYADDVKCSHGATTGEIDKQQLFYLMARGIPKAEAKRMLLNSFLVEILDDIENETVQDFLTSIALAKASEVLK